MLTLRSVLSVLAFAGLFGHLNGYAGYRTRIPNGEVVPHPCNPNHIWNGVGHVARGGGGDRNQFGKDFKKEREMWTDALCRMDSDGDGKSNGEELGDPNCTWTSGTQPQRTVRLSHPGICDPLGSDICSGKPAPICEEETFKCDALNEVGVIEKEIRLPRTPVPARETTYTCMYVDFPSDRDYHLVASTPIIDNINVMHHILLYACPDPSLVTAELNKPQDCFMASAACDQVIATWAVGINGDCYSPEAGFRIGNSEKAYKVAMLELHWNNPGFEDSWTDSSGLMLYYTPNLRPYDAGVLLIGQLHLEIPPQEQSYVAESTCSSDCTQQNMQGPIYLLSALNHMHYLGRKAVSQVVVPNGQSRYLAYDNEYNYDRPITYQFNEPIKFNPGHEFHLKCYFTSTSRTKTTFYGEGTNDEMCFVFITYYPKENYMGSGCISYLDNDICAMKKPVIQDCNTTMLFDNSHPENVARSMALEENCRVGSCLKECIAVVKEINTHPCFSGTMRKYVSGFTGTSGNADDQLRYTRFWGLLRSCDADILRETFQAVIDIDGPVTGSAVTSHGSVLALLIMAILYVLI